MKVLKFVLHFNSEYVKNGKLIFPFQCSKKDEFVKKGLALYNAKNKFMEKFPADVETAERLTRVVETNVIINDRPNSIVKAILGQTLTRRSNDYYNDSSSAQTVNTPKSPSSVVRRSGVRFYFNIKKN